MIQTETNRPAVIPIGQGDQAFIRLCEQIMCSPYTTEGEKVRPRWADGTPAHTRHIFGYTHMYTSLADDFPIMTMRRINWKAALDEIFWIYQRKSNNVLDLNSHIWDSWADETGSIGKAYGYQIAQKARYPEGEFDQMDKVLFDLKNNPMSRSIMTNTYVHSDLSEMHLRPCAYSMTYNVIKNTHGEYELNGILNQRSLDTLTAGNWNIVQYSLLLMMVAQCVGMRPGGLLHVVSDAHIYMRHEPIVKQIITDYYRSFAKLRDSGALRPVSVKLDPNIKNFYDFTVDSITVENYNPAPFNHKIEVAV